MKKYIFLLGLSLILGCSDVPDSWEIDDGEVTDGSVADNSGSVVGSSDNDLSADADPELEDAGNGDVDTDADAGGDVDSDTDADTDTDTDTDTDADSDGDSDLDIDGDSDGDSDSDVDGDSDSDVDTDADSDTDTDTSESHTLESNINKVCNHFVCCHDNGLLIAYDTREECEENVHTKIPKKCIEKFFECGRSSISDAFWDDLRGVVDEQYCHATVKERVFNCYVAECI